MEFKVEFTEEQRKWAGEALKRKKNHLAKAQEIAHVGSWDLDISSNKLLWTDEVYRIFGISRDMEPTYEFFLECVHPDDREYVDKKWKAALNKEPYDIEHRIVVGGEVKWIREKAQWVFDEKGKVIHGIGIVQDITEYKQANEELYKYRQHLEQLIEERTAQLEAMNKELEQQLDGRYQVEEKLRESEERYRRITESVTDYIYTVRFENGHPIETIHGQNSVPVTGYTSEELTADSYLWINMVPSEDQETVRQQILRCASGQATEPLEHRIIHKNGATCWVKSTLVPHFDAQGKLLSYDGLLKDITDRKHAEEALIQAKEHAEKAQKELESVNRRLETSVEQANMLAEQAIIHDMGKRQFLANMSHEIRTPMNAIMGFSEVLAEGNLTEEQNSYVNMILTSSKNLLELINDILDFSKIEAGKLDIEITDCPLGQLITSVESLMRPAANEKGLNFEIKEENDLPAQIRTDNVRLRQCLINLVSNAIKFTEEGYVHITISLLEIDNRSYIWFDIEDTGIGISAEKQKEILEPFTQADGSTSRKYGGTGLGLAITQQLVELLGGQLSLSSEVGKGSVFTLTIPAGVNVTKESHLYEHHAVTEETSGADKQIKFSGCCLIAEDSLTNRVLIKVLLEKIGLEVIIAEDGNVALQKALTQSFDLIFMDIQMPNMNGYEATRTLRKEGIATPIIALTANAMKGDDQKCISAGCDDYLSKPIDRHQLLEKLHKYLPSENQALVETADSVKS